MQKIALLSKPQFLLKWECDYPMPCSTISIILADLHPKFSCDQQVQDTSTFYPVKTNISIKIDGFFALALTGPYNSYAR